MTLQQAAQALMGAVKIDRHDTEDWPETSRKAFDELRKALADEQAQEPVSANHRTTGWVAPVDRYAVPVLFNPYTGEPRDVRDVQSDPQGVLIVPPGKAEMLAAKPTVESVTDCMMNLVDRLGHEASDVDARAWEHLLVYAPKQAQAVEPVKRWPFDETPGEFTARLQAAYESFGCMLAAVRCVLIEDPPVIIHPAPPPAGEQIDWQDMYLKQKSEKEAMAAKYGKDIGPLARVVPATGERAELIANLHIVIDRIEHGDAGIDSIAFVRQAAALLEADAQEIAGWKADQKENLSNQVELQGQINSLKAQQAVEPVAWTLTETLDKRVTTTSGYLWFSDPVNCCWTPLYTHPAPPTTGGTEDKWRKLALQFDGQRMQAHAHLSAMILNPYAHMAEAMKFLAAPPTKAQQVAVPQSSIKEVVVNADYREMWAEQVRINQGLCTQLAAQGAKQ